MLKMSYHPPYATSEESMFSSLFYLWPSRPVVINKCYLHHHVINTYCVRLRACVCVYVEGKNNLHTL